MSRSIESVRLSRGMCFGACPVYEVVLRQDGYIVWHGEAFVEPLGHHRSRIDPEDFRRVAKTLDRLGFFDWAREEMPMATDIADYRIDGDGGRQNHDCSAVGRRRDPRILGDRRGHRRCHEALRVGTI